MNVILQALISLIEKNPQIIVDLLKIIVDAITRNPGIVGDVVKGFKS